MSDYERLKALYDEIDVLIAKCVTDSDSEFITWRTKVERFLKGKYGKESDELDNFNSQSFSPIICTFDTDNSDWVEACRDGLRVIKATFEAYLQDMKDEKPSEPSDAAVSPDDFSKVFIVHGHDEALKEKMARLIERQSITPIILNEQPNNGKTIIEKIEAYSDVGAAICLFTVDDLGQEKSDSQGKPRARQNVVFEAGYFIGKLGRERVTIVSEAGVELPSDMQGVVYTDKNNWTIEVLKELKSIGYKIDFNKIE